MAAATTPMMRQYLEIKAQYPGTILFFRLGDFYEMFFEDAEIASRVLGLTLTSRGKHGDRPIPLAGVPWHKADHYVDRLLSAGYKVAVCNQTEDPKMAKGLVKRAVTEVVTPGTALSGATLDGKKPNYLVALHPSNGKAGLAAIDVTTGDFRLGELDMPDVAEEIARFDPAEVIMPGGRAGQIDLFGQLSREPAITELEDWRFDSGEGERALRDHFRVETLDGYGCSDLPLGLSAAGVLFSYLRDLGRDDLKHVDRLAVIDSGNCMVLDESTRRNLELFRPTRETPMETTLLGVIDATATSMGGRLLREWLLRPLRSSVAIEARLAAVSESLERSAWRGDVRDLLAGLCDIERLAGKLALGRGNPRDLVALERSLRAIPGVRAMFDGAGSDLLANLAGGLEDLSELADRISTAIANDPPATIKDGGIIRNGYNRELDSLRGVGSSGKEWIVEFQENERERTGISSLKVGFNRVFGYYIEVSKTKSDSVPPTYVRKQTLVNAERFITPELKEQEDKILGAEERIKALEEELFLEVRARAAAETLRLGAIGRALAALDVLLALADTAARRNYCRPTVNDGTAVEIKEGRHPVVESIMPAGKFIPNDTAIDTATSQIHLITGPNMAGKSTYLRQVALIQILAQIGSFVPAKSASLGVADRVFTRVGASDDLARGQSTFLVEMTETANILNNATDRSLILLDEIGRGTSTFDGVSIAWAVVEHLHENERLAAKTLFATHYHELADLADRFERVRNYSVRVKEWNDQIVFLRQIVPGSVDRSYGIQVARLAGLPGGVISRAKEVLHHLEEEHGGAPAKIRGRENRAQFDLFSQNGGEFTDELAKLDPDQMTPLEALQKLAELHRRAIGNEEES